MHVEGFAGGLRTLGSDTKDITSAPTTMVEITDATDLAYTRRAHHHLPMSQITITFPSSPASFLLPVPPALLRLLYLAPDDEHTT